MCADERLVQVTRRQLEALFQYSVTGDSAYLLAVQRPLMIAQDEDGDTSVNTKHVLNFYSFNETLIIVICVARLIFYRKCLKVMV